MKNGIIIYNQHPTLIYAAQELESYLDRLEVSLDGPVSLSIKEDIGISTPPSGWDPSLDDSYSILIEEHGGSITGSNPRSVLLGVYDYLRQIGFRFLQPGSRYEFIPAISYRSQLAASVRYTAPFRHRGVCLEGACSIDNILSFIEWMPKAGFNCFFVQFQLPYTFLERWYRHEGNPLLKEESFSPEIAARYDALITKALEKRSLLHHRVGHGWTCEVAGYPSCGWMEAPATKNSRYLAQLDGKRQLFHNIPLNTNLCYSCGEVISSFVERVVSYAKANPQVDYLHIWLADECNNICECEECQKTTLADQYVHLLNLIDQALTSEGLETRIVFLIYQELLWTPLQEKLQNEKRFTLMFAPISRVFMESYPDHMPEGPIPDYRRNRIELPTTLEENLAFLSRWQNVFHGDSFVYDYPLGRAHYGDISYLKIARTIYGDIHNLGVLHMDGYISCQELRAALPNGFPNYVMGMALSHPEITFEELVDDYFRHAYGAEYRRVLEYLTTLSKLYDCDYFNGKGPRIREDVHQSMKKALAVLEHFKETIKNHRTNSDLEKYYWDLLDYHNGYGVRLTLALYELSGGRNRQAMETWEAFHTYICENESRYQDVLDVYRIGEVAGKYTGFSTEPT
ncbi:MAG: DUF4838 domain-containing protein [Hungatella hathewayi]|nr:DUF4838 domain-containing protein [Hungatella hathewayi]